MELTKVYESVLAVAGLKPDSEGFISLELTKSNKTHAMVDGKRLVLPTEEQLRNPDMANRIIFHPLNESIARGESKVMSYFRECIGTRLNFIIGYIAISLLTIATSEAEHKSLSPDQTLFMDRLKDADQGTLERMHAITKAMMVGDSSKSFINFYVKKFGKIKNEKFSRVGVVSFQFYQELVEMADKAGKKDIYGVKLRKADPGALMGLMEYIIPNIADSESYYRGSNSEIAPTLEALLRTAIAVGDSINNILDIFGDKIAGHEDLYINGDWEETFNSLPSLLPKIRLIPMQPGNEGNIPKAVGTSNAPDIPVNQGVVIQQKPAVPKSMGVSADEMGVAPVAPTPVSAPVPPAIYKPYQPPQVQHGYQATAPVQPQLNANGRVDFMDVLRSNPALAAQVGAFSNQGGYGGGYGRPQPRAYGGGVAGGAAGGGYGQPQNRGYGGYGGSYGTGYGTRHDI